MWCVWRPVPTESPRERGWREIRHRHHIPMLPVFSRRTDNCRAGGPHGEPPWLLWVPTVWAQRHLHPDITSLPGRQPPSVRGRQHATLRERAGLRGDDVKPPYTTHSGVYSVCTAVEVPYRYNLNVYYVLYPNKDQFTDEMLYILTLQTNFYLCTRKNRRKPVFL